MTEKQLLKRHPLALAVFAALNFAPMAYAINFTGTTYSQNFDTLINTGTAQAWTNDSTLPGWHLFRQPASGTAITAYNANDGGSNSGAFYSYGTTSTSDRALGGLGSGGAYFGSPTAGNIAGWIAFSVTNTTGSTINSLNIAFSGEQWRNGGNTTAQTMVLEYGFGATFDAVSTWTSPGGAFDWNSPVATATAAAVDGNVAGAVSGRGGLLGSLNWTNGSTLWIRWVERNDTGNDHGLAIDNFSLTASATAGVTVTQSGGSTDVTEGGATDTYAVVLNTQPAADVTVNIAGDAQVTASPSTLTFTTANWNAAQTVTVTAVDDTNVEGANTGVITHTATSSDASYNGIGIGGVTANITDNDSAPTPTVNLSVSPNTGTEADATAITVTATASSAVTGAQTVTVAASGTNVTAGDYTLSNTAITIPDGGTTGSVTFTVVDDALSEGAETAILTISGPSAGITLGATATQNIAITDNDLPCAAVDTPIGQVQGSGATAALTGTRTVQGVVVGDYEGASPNLQGFFVQNAPANSDNDPTTSDAIFVYNPGKDSAGLGQVVQVTGTAGENQGQTQLSGPVIESCGGTDTITPTNITLPVSAADYLERYEGMLVKFAQTLYVTEHFQLGRFGQVLMSSGGKLAQPTNIATPGANALAQQAANDLNSIIVDDALQSQNPDPILFGRGGNPLSASNTLRGGDTVADLTGVMTYTWAGNVASGNAYRLRPINALNAGVPNFTAANPRPTVPAQVNGSLKVVNANLLNFFDDFTNCGFGLNDPAPATATCRGAENSTEFTRQWQKTVKNLVGTGADVIAVNEMENDGYGANSAIKFLVDKMNLEAGVAGTYVFIDVDAATGQTNALGTDAIKVGMIYKPASVTPVGTTAALNTGALGLFTTTSGNIGRSRPSLAQAFEENATGARFIAVANHFKSKGSDCIANTGLVTATLSTIDITNDVDALDGQGNCNKTRTAAAQELVALLDATDPTGTGDPDILVVGDLNSYAKEDPITTLKNDGYTNLIENRIGASGYSYAFDGQWGYLDHALASSSLLPQVQDVLEWHINSDEPSVLDYNTNFKTAGQQLSLYAVDAFRTSDHDPIIVGLNLTAPPLNPVSGTSAANILVGTSGRDVLTGFTGRDTLTGGGNRDRFVYLGVQDGIDTITDFTVNYDKIVLTGLLQSLGISNPNPLAAGYVVCTASGVNSMLSIDPDASGPALKRPLVQVNNVNCAALAVAANFTF